MYVLCSILFIFWFLLKDKLSWCFYSFVSGYHEENDENEQNGQFEDMDNNWSWDINRKKENSFVEARVLTIDTLFWKWE